MSTEKQRYAILDAAERAINAKGLTEVKMDDIAKEAGISKGGLFYHFPSKRELLLGIIERYEKTLYDLRKRIYDEMPAQPFRKLKSTLLALIEHPNHRSGDTADIITLLSDNELRRMIGRLKEELFNDVMNDSPNPKKAALVMLVFDGIWLSELLRPGAHMQEYHSMILHELLSSLKNRDAAVVAEGNVDASVDVSAHSPR